MKITIDTNFLISATQWDYSVAHKLLNQLIFLEAEIFTTQDILDETSKVLERDFKYNKDEIEGIVKNILLFVKLIEPKRKVDIVKEDPDDNKIIECALASDSEFIITYDKHLLKIRKYEKIKIVTPEIFFDILQRE